MPDWAEATQFTTAIASLVRALQWPLVILIVCWFFSAEVKQLIPRIKKGKLGPAEIELESLNRGLEAVVDQAVEDLHESPPEPPKPSIEPERAPGRDTETAPDSGLSRAEQENMDLYSRVRDSIWVKSERQRRHINDIWEVSPQMAVLTLAIEIEATVNELVELYVPLSDVPTGFRSLPLRRKSELLERKKVVQPSFTTSLTAFWRVRNVVAHSREVDPVEVNKAFDSGMRLWAATLDYLQIAKSQVALAQSGSLES